MDIKNIILIIVAALNFLLGFYILFKNVKNKVNLYFGLTIVCTGLWTLAIAIFYSIENVTFLYLWAKVFYSSGALIIFFFLLFSINFPFSLRVNSLSKLLFALPLLVVLFSVLYPKLLIKDIFFETPDFHYILEDLFWQMTFFIYFLVYLGISYYFLMKKFVKSEGLIKSQLKFVLLIMPFAFLSGIIFDIILPLYRIYYLDWLGPIFSLIVLSGISYLLFFKPTKNI